jgi:putative DNA methylase
MTRFENLTGSVHSGSLIEQVNRFVPNLQVEEAISRLAQDETGKRQYYRPVYSLHKWWARRPGTLFRAIILLATCPELREQLLQIDAQDDIDARSRFFADHDLSKWIIFDPFMGGGTTLIEANRMGARVIGSDINPVAYWIVRESLKPVDLSRLDTYFQHLERTVAKRIKSLYQTRCVYCGELADTLYAFWVRFIACQHCGQETILHKRSLLNEGASRNRPLSPSNPATVFCPTCRALFSWTGEQPACCPVCYHRFDPYAGAYNEGFYSCTHCEAGLLSLLDTIRAGASLQDRLVAIEYFCSRCNARLYKAPDADDQAMLNQIQAEYEKCQSQLVIPDQEIPLGTSSRRWIQHGYQCYRQLFNPRQILALNLLIDGIRTIPEPEYQNCFFTILSNMLEYNNMMTPYNYPNRKLHHLFNYHALPLTTMPVENAVWGVSEEGAGTFVNCYRRYRNAKTYCQQPYERYKAANGQVITIPLQKERIEAHVVETYDDLLETPRGAMLLCRDSSHLPNLPDSSVDFVITDPPYYDNVHYSELSNFFYVWLSRLVRDSHFEAPLVPTGREAIVNKGQGKSEEEYKSLMIAVFRECRRVLKEDGLLIFTFHHTKWQAWWTIYEVVSTSGFRIVDFFPVQSEYRVNPHIRNKQALDMDLVLICCKSSQPYEPLSSSPAEALERALQLIGYYRNGTRNLLFLHFMGELLRSASCAPDDWTPSYEWFRSALELFDRQVAELQIEHGTPPSEVQLALFESKEAYDGGERV